MLSLTKTLFVLASAATVVGCVESSGSSGLDPAAVGEDDLSHDDDAKADGAAGLYDYFTIRPADDGSQSWFVQRVNRQTTKCSPGVVKPFCTVPQVALADGLVDDFAESVLHDFEYTYRGHSSPWGEYFAPLLVRGTMSDAGLSITEVWNPGRYRQPTGVWVELSDVTADDSPCEAASWAQSCESRLNSTAAAPISIANLLDEQSDLQDHERAVLGDPTKQTIVVGTRARQDGLPIRAMQNIYTRMTSIPSP
ncbi:MAG TPA: hypothetical protein VGM90_28045 [Kofleriaceae bacterium]|jgi:hypothetical protein